MTKIAVIGAGLAGLTFARGVAAFADVTLFEKSRGIGGRMATRYAGTYEFDHGAQYFTVKTAAFADALQDYRDVGVVRTWEAPVALIGEPHETGAERIIAAPRMNSLCKAMAEGVDVQLKVQIASVRREGEDWFLNDSDGTAYGPFDWVVSSAPAPQARKLLPEVYKHHDEIDRVEMRGCFSVMLGFENEIALPWTAARIAGSPVGWIALNSAKPGRKTGCSVIIQSTNDWAEAHLEDERDAVQETLIAAASELADTDLSGATHQAIHRWRYAATPVPADGPYLLDKDNQLAACGDWCVGSRVESAFTSGFTLAERLAALI